jgi:hypothetical protein
VSGTEISRGLALNPQLRTLGGGGWSRSGETSRGWSRERTRHAPAPDVLLASAGDIGVSDGRLGAIPQRDC